MQCESPASVAVQDPWPMKLDHMFPPQACSHHPDMPCNGLCPSTGVALPYIPLPLALLPQPAPPYPSPVHHMGHAQRQSCILSTCAFRASPSGGGPYRWPHVVPLWVPVGLPWTLHRPNAHEPDARWDLLSGMQVQASLSI